MKHLRKITLLSFFLSLSSIGFVNAQSSVNYDPKAKAILDDVSKTAKGYTSITATFTVTTRSSSGTTDVRNGNAVISGGKYRIVLENKVKNVTYKDEYYNDSITTWTFTGKAGELTIDDAPTPTAANDNITPSNIFTFYEKGFKYTFVEEKMVGGKVLQYIDLVPEKPDTKSYTKVQLVIDKTKKQIVSVVMQNKDGSTTTYDITTMTPNLATTDATFRFDKTTHTVKTIVCLKANDDCD